MRTIESRLLQDWKIYCLQARPYIFQPRNFTRWDSEGVNVNSRGRLTVFRQCSSV